MEACWHSLVIPAQGRQSQADAGGGTPASKPNLLCTLQTNKKPYLKPGMVAHTFNLSTWEAESGGFLSSRPAWSTK